MKLKLLLLLLRKMLRKQKWVSCIDKLPIPSSEWEKFLVVIESVDNFPPYHFNVEVDTAFFDIKKNVWLNEDRWVIKSHSLSIVTVTHWMAMPEPPKINKS